MPTIVNITVAPSGGDYTSLNTALASIPADIVATDEQYNINCETFVGGLNEAVTFPSITQDATRFVRIQAAAGHEYNPVDDTGFFLISNVGFSGTFTSSIDFVQIINFGVKNNRATGNGRGIDFFGDNGVISGMYSQSTSTSSAIIFFLNNANNLNISECLAYGGNTGFDFGNNGSRTADKLTSVDATTVGIDTGTATTTITNSLSITSADPYLGTFSGSSSNNASSSTDAPGTSPQNNRTNADFANYAGNDFRTSLGSPLASAGIGGTFVGYSLESSASIVITGGVADYNYVGEAASVELAGEVIVDGGTASFDYQVVQGGIELTSEILIAAKVAGYDYSGINGDVILSGLVTVTGETAAYDYTSINGEVILQGQINITGSTADYDYNTLNGTIALKGPVTPNPKNSVRVKRQVNSVRVNRKTNFMRVR